MSDPVGLQSGLMRCIVNMSVAEFASGEVVDVDPVLFADMLESNVLSPIDEHGNRIGTNAVMYDNEPEQHVVDEVARALMDMPEDTSDSSEEIYIGGPVAEVAPLEPDVDGEEALVHDAGWDYPLDGEEA